MKCTHPVIYEKDGKMVCQVCGAVTSSVTAGAVPPSPEGKASGGADATGRGKKKGKAD